ncbi:sporulation protein [Neobacillus piezotolerans]|uniref:Sporulation protein n=1 Tax=Neobacillus piezotolerans TaxID=2259171 RepID=A0A3D8GMQ8_9BACI|nr:YhcN/YlaJ family sporulation lipoprotein [Neobacillus piezotolerans]RDU35597.1 sporulation protein [Neobacillus piezotolerans]
MKKTLVVTTAIFTILAGTGCQGRDDTARSRLALMKTTNPEPVQTQHSNSNVSEEAVKKAVAKMPELYDVAVVKGKKDILVAYKVRHMHRFRMKAIEKKVTKKLEKKYPDANFMVSSDYKIFLEATRLRDEVKRGKMSGKEAEGRLQQIIKLQQEKT